MHNGPIKPLMNSKLPCLHLYETLETTAKAFVNSIIARPASHQPDYARLYELAAPHFRISFSPRTWADQSPTLVDTYDMDSYCELVQRMTGGHHLSVQRARLREVNVDVRKCSVVVRADYYLHVENEFGDMFERNLYKAGDATGATCINETVFFLQLTECGTKIYDAVQYVDPVAMDSVNNLVCRFAGGKQNIDESSLF